MSDFIVTIGPDGSLHLGPRAIPVPTSISEDPRSA